ncbi:MAG: GNAT family N-acetyltransferase, partial [Eubacteriales bacterium]|nr:GNAT family N-acetyltransferase [Eubacteriales bacterium]
DTFKKDMQEAFQLGAVEGDYKADVNEQILPERDIDESLNAKGSVAYVAVDDARNIIGGAIRCD